MMISITSPPGRLGPPPPCPAGDRGNGRQPIRTLTLSYRRPYVRKLKATGRQQNQFPDFFYRRGART